MAAETALKVRTRFAQEVFMNGTHGNKVVTVTVEAEIAGETTELVRGQDETLLERLRPLVRTRSVILDMRSVRRIDAAGIAALITLYSMATEAGNCFTLSRATPHVEEILSLVGLERILVSGHADADAQSDLRLELAAA
jgi:anti-anti-sigma factor